MVIIQDIFSIQNEQEFNEKALEVFRFQYQYTTVYQQFVQHLGLSPQDVEHYLEIPFLPIEFFKNYKILNQNFHSDQYFQSSGTGSQIRSKHYVADISFYKESLLAGFTQYIGKPEDFVILGLLPNYLENPHSSLIFMVNELMKISQREENGYYLDQFNDLKSVLDQLAQEKQKTVLFGVSFALLDWVQEYGIDFPELVVIETGGMKGRKKEVTKTEVLDELKIGFPSSLICSEYGMTELFSQAYAIDSLSYQTPSWMKILIREIEDPLAWQKPNRTGAINIIDLANLNSCSFIATSDLGKQSETGIEVLGRLDQSELRGCSLLLS